MKNNKHVIFQVKLFRCIFLNELLFISDNTIDDSYLNYLDKIN